MRMKFNVVNRRRERVCRSTARDVRGQGKARAGMRSDRALRIAQVAPLAESVPPRLYGGTERVIAWLTDELLELGHDVTLFASGDSVTRATLVPVWPRSLRLGRPRSDPIAALAALLDMVAHHADDFDVIHCHIDWVHLPLLERLSVPFLTTMHGRLDLPGLPAVGALSAPPTAAAATTTSTSTTTAAM